MKRILIGCLLLVSSCATTIETTTYKGRFEGGSVAGNEKYIWTFKGQKVTCKTSGRVYTMRASDGYRLEGHKVIIHNTKEHWVYE